MIIHDKMEATIPISALHFIMAHFSIGLSREMTPLGTLRPIYKLRSKQKRLRRWKFPHLVRKFDKTPVFWFRPQEKWPISVDPQVGMTTRVKPSKWDPHIFCRGSGWSSEPPRRHWSVNDKKWSIAIQTYGVSMKSSIYRWILPYANQPFLGYPYLWKPPYWNSKMLYRALISTHQHLNPPFPQSSQL